MNEWLQWLTWKKQERLFYSTTALHAVLFDRTPLALNHL
jgi:hypothetical protein